MAPSPFRSGMSGRAHRERRYFYERILLDQIGGALYGPAERFSFHIGKAYFKSVPGAPGGDVATHGAPPDDMNAPALPISIRKTFELLRRKNTRMRFCAVGVTIRRAKEANFRLLHRRLVATIVSTDRSCAGGRIVFGRRFLFRLAFHAPREQFASRKRIQGCRERLARAVLSWPVTAALTAARTWRSCVAVSTRPSAFACRARIDLPVSMLVMA